MAFLDYFDRGYVINLPERVDRREEMERELEAAEMRGHPKIEFFPAIRTPYPGSFPSAAVRGCFMSHLEVLRDAQKRGLSNVLVMEDDLAISPRLRVNETAIVARLRANDWAFAHLGHALEPEPPRGAPLVPVPSAMPIEKAHFYAVRQPYVDRMVEFLETLLTRPQGDPLGGPMDLDGALSLYRSRHTEAITLVARPNLGSQRSSRSDIHPTKWDESPVLAPIVDALRVARRRFLKQRFE